MRLPIAALTPTSQIGPVALGEGIAILADAHPRLPRCEVMLEAPGRGGRPRQIIVVARHRETGNRRGADTHNLGGTAKLGLEAQGGRVAGKDDVFDAARGQLVHQPAEHLIGLGKAFVPAGDGAD